MFYGYIDVDGLGASVVPLPAKTYESLESAEAELREEAEQHFSINHQSIILRLFAGEPDGDEERYGYPDEPDHVLYAACNDFNNDIFITRC